MFKPAILSFIFSFMLISTAFAVVFDPSSATSKQCEMIATTCKQAGYTQNEHDATTTTGKYFWKNCMRPLLMGQTVIGVTVDTQTVKSCRQFKIENMQQKINELKSVQ